MEKSNQPHLTSPNDVFSSQSPARDGSIGLCRNKYNSTVLSMDSIQRCLF